MPLPQDGNDLIVELTSMYDAAVAEQNGYAQLMAINAIETHKLRLIQEASSQFVWPK